MCELKHDAWVCAYHEAGHAVLIVAVGWGGKIAEVVITPQEKEGGHVCLNDHVGRTPPDEVLREHAKNLAGPIAQVLFADHRISEPYRGYFKTSILNHFKTIDDVNNSACQAWVPDLRQYFGCVQRMPDLCDDYFIAERFVRILFARPSVSNAIQALAEKLHEELHLSGNTTREIIHGFLDAGDYVGEDDIAQIGAWAQL